jgi:hypothetical protein
MKRETLIWTIVLGLGFFGLLARSLFTEKGMANIYVRATDRTFVRMDLAQEAPAEGRRPPETRWVEYTSEMADQVDLESLPAEAVRDRTSYEQVLPRDYYEAEAANPEQTEIRWSASRTIGIWVAAFFTLAIFSFLYKDNVFYKIAESILVGVSAGYWMVVGFWDIIVPNLMGKIWPQLVKQWAMPGLEAEKELLYLVPLALGVMLIWRLAPKGSWISRWPLAFIIGTTAGLRLISFLHANFLAQISNSIVPLVVMQNGQVDVADSLRNTIMIIGILACLVYFFFSFEHKGFVGKTAKLGIWFLMITFGAGFGYTVMGRIALLAIRLEFLFDDWLWLIDPTNSRIFF